MPVFFAFVLKRPWIVVLAALTLLCGVLAARMWIVKSKLDGALLQLTVLSAQVENQNRAIETWRDVAAVQAARARAAQKDAARIRAEGVAKASKILTEPVPYGCPEAVEWGAQKGAELARSWEDGR